MDYDVSVNKPFAELLGSLKQALLERPRAPPASGAPASRSDPSPPAPSPPDPADPAGEQRYFLREMQGVTPLERGNYVPLQRDVRTPAQHNDDAEALAELADLVHGRAYFDITNSDEYIEGIAHGLDRRLLKKLRRGHFSLQGVIDLHGLTRQEARELLPRFISRSRAQRRRCVLIVHGRGLNSKDQIPVLKESLKVWLSRGTLSRSVLAFCTARPNDGGAGAVYALLRK